MEEGKGFVGQKGYPAQNPVQGRDRLESLPKKPAVDCLVSTFEQFRAVARWGRCRRIYVESGLFLQEKTAILGTADEVGADCYVALPYILRDRDETFLGRLSASLAEAGKGVHGILLRNLEEAAFVRELLEKAVCGPYHLVSDAGLYCFNSCAARFLSEFMGEITLPYELNAKEAMHLSRAAAAWGVPVSLIVYSRIPMMVTANCIQKTAGLCGDKGEVMRQFSLKDRQGAIFPVVINCDHCYNVLYNSVPYSLHGAKKERDRIGASAFRYDFTLETGEQCGQILEERFPFAEYTAGHCRRGVE